MTSGTARNGTSKFSPTRPPISGLLGAPLAQPGDDVVDFGGFEGNGYPSYDDASRYGYEAQAAQAGGAAYVGTAGYGIEPGRNTGRHAGALGKATRKRVRRVVPVAAVAATLAAGTAAYVLASGGQPHSASTSMAVHGAVASAAAIGTGTSNEAASAPIKVATAKASDAARTPAKHAATVTPSRTAAAVSPAASSPAAQPRETTPVKAPAAAPVATKAVTQASSSAASQHATATTVSCNTNSSLLPANVTAIVNFLLANGYSDNAAAGIAGNIYQESKGDPESVGSGGGGLIGWTPLRPGLITGNTTADLQTQLSGVLTYNQVWSQFLPALNSAASPASAASIYVTDFERAGIPAASTREASAQAVASACGI